MNNIKITGLYGLRNQQINVFADIWHAREHYKSCFSCKYFLSLKYNKC